MVEFVTAHSGAILSSLLALSEVIALWVGKGGIIVSIISGLKALGAKEPS